MITVKKSIPFISLEQQFANLPTDWQHALTHFINTTTYQKLCEFVDSERAAGKIIYPDDVFRALYLTSPPNVKVVILGQDPYHGEDKGIPQAHGLAFSVKPEVIPPPSLRNIFKEITAEFGYSFSSNGCLDHWAKQGVLLLNTVLTVERQRPASHAKKGWEQCTDALITYVSQQQKKCVFMLWGAHAQTKRSLLNPSNLVLEAPHPSPLSAHRGFLGCGHFAKANQFLEKVGIAAIDWQLP